MVKVKISQGGSTQKSIKIDGGLWDELDYWIDTHEAKSLGFNSKADFATQAIREMLERYTVDKKAFEKFLRIYQKHSKYLKSKRKVNNASDFAGFVEKMLKHELRL